MGSTPHKRQRALHAATEEGVSSIRLPAFFRFPPTHLMKDGKMSNKWIGSETISFATFSPLCMP
jgi:hypothetical protein